MTRDEILGVVRHVVTAAAGALAADGVISSSQAQIVAGAVVFLLGAAWSVLQKRRVLA